MDEMNGRKMGEHLMEARPMQQLCTIKEEQTLRSQKFDGLAEVNDGYRRGKNPEYPNRPGRPEMKSVMNFSKL